MFLVVYFDFVLPKSWCVDVLSRARVYGSHFCNPEVNFVAIRFDVPHSPSFSF